MNSRQLQSQNYSEQLSKLHSDTLSVQLQTTHDHRSPLSLENIQFMQEKKLSELGEYLETHLYKNLIEKVTKHIVNAIQRQKVLEPIERFSQQKFIEDLNNHMKNKVDRLDVWIAFNLIQREDVMQMKNAVVQREERKKLKCKEIDNLLGKIVEKQKEKKAQNIMNEFLERRRANYVRFSSNPEIEVQKEKNNKLLKRVDDSESAFQKAEEKLRFQKKKSSELLGLPYSSKLDEMKFF